MPTVSAMLARGTHRLYRLALRHAVEHAGGAGGPVLRQPRQDVPGYRWFDREEQQLRVVSNPADLRAAGGAGVRPLAARRCWPAVRASTPSCPAGAAKRLMTVSALGELRQRPPRRRAGRLQPVLPQPQRLHQGACWPASGTTWPGSSWAPSACCAATGRGCGSASSSWRSGAVANAFLRETVLLLAASRTWCAGVPVIYTNFVGYDDVAHYSGPDDYEAQHRPGGLRPRPAQAAPLRPAPRGASATRIVLLSTTARPPSCPSACSTADRWVRWWRTWRGRWWIRAPRPATPPTSTRCCGSWSRAASARRGPAPRSAHAHRDPRPARQRSRPGTARRPLPARDRRRGRRGGAGDRRLRLGHAWPTLLSRAARAQLTLEESSPAVARAGRAPWRATRASASWRAARAAATRWPSATTACAT